MQEWRRYLTRLRLVRGCWRSSSASNTIHTVSSFQIDRTWEYRILKGGAPRLYLRHLGDFAWEGPKVSPLGAVGLLSRQAILPRLPFSSEQPFNSSLGQFLATGTLQISIGRRGSRQPEGTSAKMFILVSASWKGGRRLYPLW